MIGRLLFGALLCLASVSAFPATTEATYGASFGGGPRNITVTAPSSGNSFVLILYAYSGTISSVTDNGGATPTYQTDLDFAIGAGSDRVYYFSRHDITDSPTQLTVTYGTATSTEYVLVEVSGIDGTVVNTGTTSWAFTTAPSVSATSTGTDDYGLAFHALNVGSRTYTADAGWTAVAANAGRKEGFYDDAVGSVGTITSAPTLGGGGTQVGSTIVLYDAAGGGSTILPLLNSYYR